MNRQGKSSICYFLVASILQGCSAIPKKRGQWEEEGWERIPRESLLPKPASPEFPQQRPKAVCVCGRDRLLDSLSPPCVFAVPEGGPQRRGALHCPREARVARLRPLPPLRCAAWGAEREADRASVAWSPGLARPAPGPLYQTRRGPERPSPTPGSDPPPPCRAWRALASREGGHGRGGRGPGERGPLRPWARAATGTARAGPGAPGECGAGAAKLARLCPVL